MTNQSLKILSLLFGGLLLFWLLSQRHTRDPQAPRLWREAQSAVRLEIIRSNDTASLELRPGGWELTRPFEATADVVVFNRLLKQLARIRLSKALSQDESRHYLFGVNTSTGIRVRGWIREKSQPVLDVWIGAPGASVNTFFIRSEGEQTVYEARGMGRYLIDVPSSSWAESIIVELDTTRVLWFDAGRGRMERSDGDFSTTSVQTLMRTWSRFSADAVEARPTGPWKAWKSVLIGQYGPDGKEAPDPLRIEIGPLKNGEHTIRSSETPLLQYRIGAWRLDTLRTFFN